MNQKGLSMHLMEKPELLMPAGSFRKMEVAFAYGADAVYLGVPFFSLRVRGSEFDQESLVRAVDYAHSRGKKVYLTLNVFARNRKLGPFREQITDFAKLDVDAFIMSDPGLIAMVRERHPEVPVHLSVQANSMNYETARFWHKSLGISRVILSRELNLNEIIEIRQRVPELELEAFVHGAICIAYSGRCLISSYLSYRDANQGVCDNSCREKFHVYKAEKEHEDYFVEDLRSKGELLRVDEDESGTYLFNAKDLCLIDRLKEIADAGICSFKVEGRSKTEFYVASVARAYRRAIDDMLAGRPFDPSLKSDLEKIVHRGYHSGFMFSDPDKDSQNYKQGMIRNSALTYAGLVVDTPEVQPGFLAVDVKNPIHVGDTIEALDRAGQNSSFVVEEIRSPGGQPFDEIHGGRGVFWLKTQAQFDPMTVLMVGNSTGQDLVLPNSFHP